MGLGVLISVLLVFCLILPLRFYGDLCVLKFDSTIKFLLLVFCLKISLYYMSSLSQLSAPG